MLLITIFSLFIIRQCLTVALTRYMGYWAQLQYEFYYSLEDDKLQLNTGQEFDNSGYIQTSILLVLAAIITTFFIFMLMTRLLVKTDTVMHAKMLLKVSRAVVSFFDTTPVGRILNRFSSDLGILDGDNREIIYDLINGMTLLAFLTFYVWIENIILILPSVLAVFIFYKITTFYSFPGLELRRIELVSRSPIYSEISSTLNGLLPIRVYNQGNRFIKDFLKLLYDNSKAYLMYFRAYRLFGILLDSVVFIFTAIGLLSFAYVASHMDIESGTYGVALYYLILIYTNSVWTTRQTTFLRLNMQSAERIQEYHEIPEEPPASIPLLDSKLSKEIKAWPYEGKIVFKNVFLRYPSTNQYALNNLSFTIESRSKVAIVGRTGAGKSSVIHALFRLAKIEENPNSLIQIDDINTKDLGLEFLRKSLSILPQTPVIFAGTIRRNLDPFNEYSDQLLWETLDQVNLKKYIQSLEQKLETDMLTGGSIFSAGQKQLVCLARVLLRKSKIVILDEATANVDIDTDNFIQQRIKDIFRECSVLTIAHRLTTISHYDKILVLDKGEVVEYDHPYKLLVNKIGDREITKIDGQFTQMVLKNGAQVAEKIFKDAYTNYINSNQ